MGETETETPRSEEATGSTRIEVMLVLFEGTGSMVVEFVTVAEPWMVVPAAVPAFAWKVTLRVLAAEELLSTAL